MAPNVLLESEQFLQGAEWSSDGLYLIYNSGGSSDVEGGIWYRKRRADSTLSQAFPFLLTPADEGAAQFGPDNRHVAYTSNESGRFEVYVRPFPPAPGKWQVSTSGGAQARWSPDGRELFYVEGTTLMAAPVSIEPSFSASRPRRLFDSADLRAAGTSAAHYDVFPDGERFLTITSARTQDSDAAGRALRVVENWYEEFRKRD